MRRGRGLITDWLPGTAADACQLPIIGSAIRFDRRYGPLLYDARQDSGGLGELEVALAQLKELTAAFGETSSSLAGPDLLNAAEVALRRIGRIETSIEPVFAGLSFASYGKARTACIEARSGVGNILDSRALGGDL